MMAVCNAIESIAWVYVANDAPVVSGVSLSLHDDSDESLQVTYEAYSDREGDPQDTSGNIARWTVITYIELDNPNLPEHKGEGIYDQVFDNATNDVNASAGGNFFATY